MGPSVTNYAEIQQEEVEVLRSVYADDFVEEKPKTAAWNKTADRAFHLSFRATSDPNDRDAVLKLGVSLPSTYPRTFPRLDLSFGDGISDRIKRQCQDVISKRPKELIDQAMIYGLAISIQEILDTIRPQNAPDFDQEVPTLDQERINQQAVAFREAEQEEQERLHHQRQAQEEESRVLAERVQNTKSRSGRRKSRTTALEDGEGMPDFQSYDEEKGKGSSMLSDGGDQDGVWFDQRIDMKNLEGASISFRCVSGKVEYRRGRGSILYTVHPGPTPRPSRPFLALKQCSLDDSKKDKKQSVQSLETNLESMHKLKTHPNVMRLLGFRIQSLSTGWDISLLTGLASNGSMLNLLKMIGTPPLERTRVWALQLISGLDHLHRSGIPHLNVHLNNVLLQEDETGTTVAQWADPGYNMHLIDGNLPDTNAASVFWIPPEMNVNGQPTLATDIWNLGAMLLQMLFGLDSKNIHTSPASMMKELGLSRPLRALLQPMFDDDQRKRPTPFELLPSEFLRSNAPAVDLETVQPGVNVSSQNRRRESLHSSTTKSRYASDFVESGRLGRGGYGVVVKARNKLDNQFYAIKKIKQRSAIALSNVLSEVMLLSRLNHPNVVRYFAVWIETDEAITQLAPNNNSSLDSGFDSGPGIVFGESQSRGQLDFISSGGVVFGESSDDEDNGENDGSDEKSSNVSDGKRPDNGLKVEEMSAVESSESEDEKELSSTLYIQMEYCEKQTLRDLIHDGLHAKVDECWRLFRQILEGLAHIHGTSIVHRDLKPDNIFIGSQGDVRIGDFGLARPGDYETSMGVKGNPRAEIARSFTRSVGTSTYVAPEVRSGSKGRYNEKADMYSLGICLFEMTFPLETSMERAKLLAELRKEEHTLPSAFEMPEKQGQGTIILSLVNHKASERPSSAELLHSGKVPLEADESKMIRMAASRWKDPKNPFRRELLDEVWAEHLQRTKYLDPSQTVTSGLDDEDLYQRDAEVVIDEWLHSMAEKPAVSADLQHLQTLIKDKLTAVFRRHKATEVHHSSPSPFAAWQTNYEFSAFSMMTKKGTLLQLPYDLTLPNARAIATGHRRGGKTYTFGEVFRSSQLDDQAKSHWEVHFDIVSDNLRNSAQYEAEAIKVLDEIIESLPGLSKPQMCYRINHSYLLNAILAFCNINRTKWRAVKNVLTSFHFGDWNRAKVRHELRHPSIAVPSTSIDELFRFDFWDTYESAVAKLRHLLQETTSLEHYFAHLRVVTTYLQRLGVKRKVYVAPLSCLKAEFYRGNLMFECTHDIPNSRKVFAAGGRYDGLIKEQLPKAQRSTRYAVGFSLSLDQVCSVMSKYLRGQLKSKAKRKLPEEIANSWEVPREGVLIDSFDSDLLDASGPEIAQELWANDISALIADEGLEKDSESRHIWTVMIKQQDVVKVMSDIRKTDEELRRSELLQYLKGEIRDHERSEGRDPDKLRLHRQTSHQETSVEAPDVRVLTTQTRGKKTNRRTIVEEAIARAQELIRGLAQGAVIVAIEIKDDLFDGLRATRLSDPEGWKRFIQAASPADRQYLQQVQQLLKDIAKENGEKNAFIYNFRTRACRQYDLG